jgi:peptide/nickel transport system permease protein
MPDQHDNASDRNPEMTEASEGESKGYWRSAWGRFRKHKTGMFGFFIFILMLGTAFCAPVLSNSKPIMCKYKGNTYFPAVVEVFHNVPFGKKVYDVPKPFRFPTFSSKKHYGKVSKWKALKAKGEGALTPAEASELKRLDASMSDHAEDYAVWPFVPFDPLEVNPRDRLKAPNNVHKLGTDDVGRDVAARMIHATSIAMMVGFISMGIAVVIAIILGSVAGYMGGWVDIVISRFIEIVICFPTFFLILSIMVWLEPDIKNVMIVIGLTAWTGMARLIRGEFLRLKGLDYTLAARALGAQTPRVIFRHLLPNGLTPVLVVVTFGIAGAIFTESGLSWLGFGVMPPTPSWGNILRSGWNNMAIHLIVPPCVAIFIAVLTMNLMGDALRDVTDPRLTSSG